MSHFTHFPCFMQLPMFGKTKEEIIETEKYYAFERGYGKENHIPREEDIIEIPQLKIECFLPVFHIDHFIEAKVLDDTVLSINTNALEHVLEQLKRSEELKRGALYKFSPGQYFNPGMFPYICLPEKVMKAMKEYDWAQHNEQLRKWGIIEQDFNEMLQNSNMITLMHLSRFKNKRKRAPRPSRN